MGLLSFMRGAEVEVAAEAAPGEAEFSRAHAAAAAGEIPAQRALGELYRERAQYREAMEWYLCAARQGDAVALYRLGEMYEEGQGELPNMAQALRCYTEAAQRGHAGAQYAAARCWARGQGCERDDAMAVAWFEEAAQRGHAGAQHHLGVAYRRGLGVVQDLEVALRWFRRAAEQGHARAQRELALLNAEPGAWRSDVEAYMWARLAARSDPTAEGLRLSAASRLDERQIVEAERLADAWLASRARSTPGALAGSLMSASQRMAAMF